jgi:hypothetical protein
MENNIEKVLYISRKKTIVTIIILLILGFIVCMGLPAIRNKTFGLSNQSQMMVGMPPPHPGYSESNGLITDTREFLKTSYSAQIKTRDVPSVMDKAESIIHDMGGRVDSINNSTKSGYINFVIPKTEFYEFKDQIEKLTNKKLFTETEFSQNLLGQKQNIEQEADIIVKSLAELNTEKQNITNQHSKTINSINTNLASVGKELTSIKTLISSTTNADLLSTYRNQENILLQKQSTLNQNKNQENSSYTTKIANINTQINQANGNLDINTKKDIQFGNNIETVNGNISVNWITIWKIVEIYSPIPMSLVVLIFIILLWIILRKTKVLPKIKFI